MTCWATGQLPTFKTCDDSRVISLLTVALIACWLLLNRFLMSYRIGMQARLKIICHWAYNRTQLWYIPFNFMYFIIYYVYKIKLKSPFSGYNKAEQNNNILCSFRETKFWALMQQFEQKEKKRTRKNIHLWLCYNLDV